MRRRVWRTALILLGCLVALPIPFQLRAPGSAGRPSAVAISCAGGGAHTGGLHHTLLGRSPDDGVLAYWIGERLGGSSTDDDLADDDLGDHALVDTISQNLLGQSADPGGQAYWLGLVAEHGRHRVASWIAESEFARPHREAPMCATVRRLGLTEVEPGLAVGQTGETITVVADRRAVTFRAEHGPPRRAESVAGDIVVNANWFTAQGAQAPIVMDGQLGGSDDIAERGQLLARRPGCSSTGEATELQHLWTGDTYQHDPCVVAAVSGVSLVHGGLRADAYPGFNITTGYTNTSRSHSFIGFNDTEIAIVATREMTASQLADYALSLGLTEGIMLDGGGSTQIQTPTSSLASTRAVPAFAVLDSAFG
ncbi:MAG: phosphodiester glycosidase family protein [Acidimicrobiales bacterium]